MRALSSTATWSLEARKPQHVSQKQLYCKNVNRYPRPIHPMFNEPGNTNSCVCPMQSFLHRLLPLVPCHIVSYVLPTTPSGRGIVLDVSLIRVSSPSASPSLLLGQNLLDLLFIPCDNTIFLARGDLLARLANCSDDLFVGECVLLDVDLDGLGA